ncbi:MAG: GIY-YIG nuclease family protein [Mariniphaga sp.]
MTVAINYKVPPFGRNDTLSGREGMGEMTEVINNEEPVIFIKILKGKGNMINAGYVYIMTNKNKTTLYIGVTNNLCRRIYEHKNHIIKDSFTDRYNLEYCIYYEEFPYFDLAIRREKELKKWNRQKKVDLINKKNPEWKVCVTEYGFIRNEIPFSEQVSILLKEVRQIVDSKNESDL